MVTVEGGDRLGELQRVGGGGGDADRAADDACVLVHGRAGARRLGEDRLRARKQVGAGGRELDTATRPPQQRQAELGLQPPHLLRQRGLADVHGLRRAAEVAVPGDGGEVLELPELHGGRLSSRGSARQS
jgi:hypothetical protein